MFKQFCTNFRILNEFPRNLNQKQSLGKWKTLNSAGPVTGPRLHGSAWPSSQHGLASPSQCGAHDAPRGRSPCRRRCCQWLGHQDMELSATWASAGWGRCTEQLERGWNSPRRCNTSDAAEWGRHGGVLPGSGACGGRRWLERVPIVWEEGEVIYVPNQ
jgi:hypothetical protein